MSQDSLNTTGIYSSSRAVRFISWNPSGTLGLLVGDSGPVLSYDGTLRLLPKVTSSALYSVSWIGDTAYIVGSSGRTLSYSGGVLTKLASNTSSGFLGIAWRPS